MLRTPGAVSFLFSCDEVSAPLPPSALPHCPSAVQRTVLVTALLYAGPVKLQLRKGMNCNRRGQGREARSELVPFPETGSVTTPSGVWQFGLLI